MTKKELKQKVKNLEKEVEESEITAYKGYDQAYEIIKNLRDRLETRKEEYELSLKEMYHKLKETKNFIIDKFDLYLDNNGYDKNAEVIKQEVEVEFTHKNIKIDLSGKNEI